MSHLRICFLKGSVSFDKHLKQLQDQGRDKVRISFADAQVESIDYRDVEAWLDRISFEGAPTCKVEIKKHPKWVKVDPISANKVIGAMLAMTEALEENIKVDMKHKKVSVFMMDRRVLVRII